MVDIKSLKQDIIRTVRENGPVLPIQISRKLGKDTYFAGAVLSELVKEKLIRITYGKIGGSPLYYVEGQEYKLNVIYSYLPQKEKEAYTLLSGNKVLNDDGCEPSIRVALRNIKDFAFPFEANETLFWRWYLVSESEARKIIEETKLSEQIKLPINDLNKNQEKLIKTVKKPVSNIDLLNVVRNYLNDKKIVILDVTALRKGNEVEGRIKINSDLGALEYFLVAKNKKKLRESDLILVSDIGRKNKLPVLFLCNGELSKKGQKYLEDNLKGRVIFRKI